MKPEETKSQIDQMAKDIKQTFEKAELIGAICPSPNMIATDLCNKGYSKQSEGEWEMTPNYKGDTLNAYWHRCLSDGCGYFYKDVRPYGHNFCPNCGAKMSKQKEVKDYPPYLDRPKHTRTPKERGADKPKITCLNCKHLMFSDMYGECNKQLKIVNPSDTCEYAEPNKRR